jgi:hypothetical protein
VAKFSGSGLKKTTPFQITASNVRVRYTATSNGSGVVISLNNANTGETADVLVNKTYEGNQSDEGLAYGVSAGSYYLEMDVSDDWSVVVEEK